MQASTDYDTQRSLNGQLPNKLSYEWINPPQLLLQRLHSKLNDVLLGKEEMTKQVITALLGGGHLLIEDMPGVGKTMLATALARLIGGEFKRIQFTSDMMPADLTGSMVLDQLQRNLVFRPGPLMANVVLADELNRTSPRTQSALLESLEEGKITVEGVSYSLPKPFMVIATQNPLSYEGTFTLPEAQLDRFMMQLQIGYPSTNEEQQLLEQYAQGTRIEADRLRPILSLEEWNQMQLEAKQVYVHPSLVEYMVRVADATRSDKALRLGLSPRALRDWLRASQALAYLEQRGYLLPDDLLQQAEAVLAHRVMPSSKYGESSTVIIQSIVRRVSFTESVQKSKGGRRR